jgi:hypothetical protein
MGNYLNIGNDGYCLSDNVHIYSPKSVMDAITRGGLRVIGLDLKPMNH